MEHKPLCNPLNRAHAHRQGGLTMMHYPTYTIVTVEPSNSSFGRWVVKVSDVTFRFFWKKDHANAFAAGWNSAAPARKEG
jgi:hypothetical protein